MKQYRPSIEELKVRYQLERMCPLFAKAMRERMASYDESVRRLIADRKLPRSLEECLEVSRQCEKLGYK